MRSHYEPRSIIGTCRSYVPNERYDDEDEVTIRYQWSAGERDSATSPGCPAMIEILSVRHDDGRDLTSLADADDEPARMWHAEVWEAVGRMLERFESQREDAAEARAEARKEARDGA
jgi:hypothetical protein